MARPGWYESEAHGGLTWWDGQKWDPSPMDAAGGPGEPTSIDSTILFFRCDPAWPQAPLNWYPPPLWEPKGGWPSPRESLWQVDGASEDDELRQLSAALEILQEESSGRANIWKLDNTDDIPMIQVAPISTSPKAPGVMGRVKESLLRRDSSSTDPRSWQHDPEILAYKMAEVEGRADQRSRTLASSTIGISVLLSNAEGILCVAAQLTPLALSPLPSAARHGFARSADPKLSSALASAHNTLKLDVSNLRTYLLAAAYGSRQIDGWLWQLRLALIQSRESYIRAAKSASDGVFSATTGAVAEEVKRLKPRHSQRRASLLTALADIKRDIDVRSRALTTIAVGQTDEADDAMDDGDPVLSEPRPAWELAEELAAQHLRSRGFSDARRAPSGSDGGIDVEGRGVIAQVKYRGTPVSRPDVQRLAGANQSGSRMAFYSRSGFTGSAIEYADALGIGLFQLNVDEADVTIVNRAGEILSGSHSN